jgi:hypothetical protein
MTLHVEPHLARFRIIDDCRLADTPKTGLKNYWYTIAILGAPGSSEPEKVASFYAKNVPDENIAYEMLETMSRQLQGYDANAFGEYMRSQDGKPKFFYMQEDSAGNDTVTTLQHHRHRNRLIKAFASCPSLTIAKNVREYLTKYRKQRKAKRNPDPLLTPDPVS